MQILSTSYFGCIAHFSIISQSRNYEIETKEHFVKQSQRNRCQLYGANGKLSLSIPLKKWKNHTPIEEVEISYEENWQSVHWKSIESAYRTSPFFEFYELDFEGFYKKRHFNKLIEFNSSLEEKALELLNIDAMKSYTTEYKKQKRDWRTILNPKVFANENQIDFPEYIQSFSDKHGFLPNLSILDLLFNLGPESKTYLNSIKLL